MSSTLHIANIFPDEYDTPLPSDETTTKCYTLSNNDSKKFNLHFPSQNILPYPRFSYNNTSRFSKDNTFLVSFKKFHVTGIQQTGYNKIYENRRSKSFFFELVDQPQSTNQIHLKIHTNDLHMSTTPKSYTSTSTLPNAKFQISKSLQHFFSAQKVIPKRIQHKYFDLIRKKLLDRILIIKSRAQKIDDRNYSTKTFFNFSYKRYRFHFGIFIPCSYHLTPCPSPSPIVMSGHRYGCDKHFYDINPMTYHRRNNDNNKVKHANLTFNKWFNRDKKEIFSNRLGIRYSTSILAKGSKHIFHHKFNRYMYDKRLDNFRFAYSDKARTRKKQEMRFNRTCRRVFNKDKQILPECTNDRMRLIKGTNHRFLFSRPQHIDKTIKHLRYSPRRKFIVNRDYNYNTPFLSFKKRIPQVQTLLPKIHRQNFDSRPLPLTQTCDVTFVDYPRLTNTPKELHPLPPDMDPAPKPSLIPYDIRPYIPDGPIYSLMKQKNKLEKEYTYLTPGSDEWIKYIRKNIQNGSLPYRDHTKNNSIPVNIYSSSETKKRQETIRIDTERSLDATTGRRIFVYKPRNKKTAPTLQPNPSNMISEERVSITPTTPTQRTTPFIQLPSPSNTNDSLAEDSNTKFFFRSHVIT